MSAAGGISPIQPWMILPLKPPLSLGIPGDSQLVMFDQMVSSLSYGQSLIVHKKISLCYGDVPLKIANKIINHVNHGSINYWSTP